MIFSITHRTAYRYSRPIFLEPQIVRLQPGCDAAQRLLNYQLKITPEPAGRCEFLDAEGNRALSIWFDQLTAELTLESHLRIETMRNNPFDYLLTDPSFQQLPVEYAPSLQPSLACYRQQLGTSEVEAFATRLAAESSGPGDFLALACSRIYEGFECIIRPEGLPYPPEKTLQAQQGSCRDLALLYIAVCRYQGLAARFVSGYQEGDQGQDDRQLHAWAEIYLPGAGWRGYDPTHGLAVSDRHISVAASYHPAGAAPLSGAFRGTGVSAEFDFFIDLKAEG